MNINSVNNGNTITVIATIKVKKEGLQRCPDVIIYILVCICTSCVSDRQEKEQQQTNKKKVVNRAHWKFIKAEQWREKKKKDKRRKQNTYYTGVTKIIVMGSLKRCPYTCKDTCFLPNPLSVSQSTI